MSGQLRSFVFSAVPLPLACATSLRGQTPAHGATHCANDDTVKLARGLRAAPDQTSSQRGATADGAPSGDGG